MSDVQEIQLRDPLSDVTRKERRLLLCMSIVSIAVIKTGLLPTKVEMLGIEFGKTDQHSLIFILAAVNIYFLSAFILYSLSDFLAWRLAHVAAVRENLSNNKDMVFDNPPVEEFFKFYIHRSHVVFFLSKPVSIIRALFEFVLPIIVGIYAVSQLLRGIQ